MVLEPEERKLFFSNWLGLLAYVNKKHKLVKGFGQPVTPVGIKPETIIKIKNKLWKKPEIIDEYIDSVWDLPNDNIQILKSWKKGIAAKFLVVRHLKKHSVFLHTENHTLYGVYGITSPIAEMIPTECLPVLLDTVLIPFKGVIIYDSVFQIKNISFGSNMRREYNQIYLGNKKNIITTL